MKKRSVIIVQAIILLTAVFSSFVMTGCGKAEEAFYPEYGKAVWLCSSANLIGFRGIYADEDRRVTLVFNERYTMNGRSYNLGLNKLFTEEVYPEGEYLSLGNPRTESHYYNEDLDIDGSKMTISFLAKDEVDIDAIDGFAIFTDEAFYRVIFAHEFLEREVYIESDDGNDVTESRYRQTYDEKRDVWSKPVETHGHKHEIID